MASSISYTIDQLSQSISLNASYCRFTVKITTTGESYNQNEGASGEIWIDGSLRDSYSGKKFAKNTTTTLRTFETYIYHYADGTKTVYSDTKVVTGIAAGTLWKSASKTLTKINRVSLLNSVDNFNIEEGLKASVTKYVSSYSDTLRILTGSTLIKTVPNYTNLSLVTFTDEEIKTIYNLIPLSAISSTFSFVIDTYSGATKIGSSATKTAVGTILGNIKVKVGGVIKRATAYVKNNNIVKRALAYTKVNGQIKR